MYSRPIHALEVRSLLKKDYGQNHKTLWLFDSVIYISGGLKGSQWFIIYTDMLLFSSICPSYNSIYVI